MIVPKFWAESTLQVGEKRRRLTVRRFGWSDIGQAEAQQHADARARDAAARFTAGEKIERREPKAAYNGADGVPIREEIVARYGEAVVTRNSYGARCLNTPNVLFADLDFAPHASCLLTSVVFVLFVAAALVAGMTTAIYVGRKPATAVAVAILLLGLVLSWGLADRLMRFVSTLTGGPERRARRRIDRFLASHPDWNVRLYRTPAGLRVLAMHRTFDPREPEVAECFAALGTDPVYVRMCHNQNCFRARVSPKPWRIGIEKHLRPRPGIWPVAPERMPLRLQWIENYEAAARNFAACRFVEALGSGGVNPTARSVQTVHDELCQATKELPIA